MSPGKTAPAADAIVRLQKALKNCGRGRAAFLDSRTRLNTAREILQLADRCFASGDLDAVRHALRKLASCLDEAGAHQSAAGGSFSIARNAVQQAVAHLEGSALP